MHSHLKAALGCHDVEATRWQESGDGLLGLFVYEVHECRAEQTEARQKIATKLNVVHVWLDVARLREVKNVNRLHCCTQVLRILL